MVSRSSLVAVVAAALLALLPNRAAACSCIAPPPPAEALEASSDVFEGVVESIEVVPGDDGDDGPGAPGAAMAGMRVTFAVVRTWKGADAERFTVWTASSSAACGYAFEQGESYLVYASDGAGDGPPQTGLCSRTAKALDAADDLVALGAGVVPVDVDPTTQTPEPASPPPARGGCASCAAGGDGPMGALGWALALLAGLAARRRREGSATDAPR